MKKKLKLDDFRVKSFITDGSQFDVQTLKGGALPVDGNEPMGRSVKWFCTGDQPDGGETVLNICETVYYDC